MSDSMLEVWSVRDGVGPDRKTFWKHVGKAFVNRDGSINVLLDALPLTGKLQLRRPKPEATAAAAAQA